jgi:hypothetical protein
MSHGGLCKAMSVRVAYMILQGFQTSTRFKVNGFWFKRIQIYSQAALEMLRVCKRVGNDIELVSQIATSRTLRNTIYSEGYSDVRNDRHSEYELKGTEYE